MPKSKKHHLIQLSCDPEFYEHLKKTKERYMYLSFADVLRDAYRRQFLEGRSSSGKDKEEIE